MFLIMAAVLFLVLFPLVNRMDFPQNDDWVYYEMVETFMSGDLTLDPYTGPTFYTQGIIAAGFAKLFGLAQLPTLTFLFGVVNFYLLSKFLHERLHKSVRTSLLLGLIFFFNPLNIYLLMGFMTAQYFIFFLLLSIWFYSYYSETQESKYLWLLILTSLLGLLVRQVSMFIPFGLGFYHLLKLQFKKAGLFFTIFTLFYYYYQNIFPQSARMIEVPLQYHHFTDFDYTFAVSFGVLIVVTALLFPLFLGSIDFKKVFASKLKLFLTILLGFGIYHFALNAFNPHEVSWGEFPYFENTLERTGLYPRGVSGTKYQFRWNFDLYYYWDLASKVLLVSFISYVLIYRKRILNEYAALTIVYVGMLVVTETFYDRYILVAIPLLILFFAKELLRENRVTRLMLFGFLFFLMSFSYQLAHDFIGVNEYVWHRSEKLVVDEGIDRSRIQGTNAWKLKYRNQNRNYLYNFSYDSPDINEDYANLYTLVEEKEISFPGNIFINPKVYLYKLN